MIEWMTVISLILFGLALLVAEIIFVPGTTLVGLFGFVFLAVGVYLSFNYFGQEIGWITVGGSAVASGVLFYLAFKSNLWGRFSLKSSSDSKVNEGELDGLKEGEEGIAMSALRPSGKAELMNKSFEVRTQGAYVDSGTRIRIIKILSNQIIVEPIS
ncbi:MAG: NfeD family protein [Bacteroidia bacterium]|nr:NfeD family protein [Bacteroidia bacterium]